MPRSLNDRLMALRRRADREPDPARRAALLLAYADRLTKLYSGEAQLSANLKELSQTMRELQAGYATLDQRLDDLANYVNRGKLPRDMRFQDIRYQAQDLAIKAQGLRYSIERIFNF